MKTHAIYMLDRVSSSPEYTEPKLVTPIIFQHFRFNRWMEGRGGWQKLNSIGVGGLHCNGNRANIGQSGHILY